MTCSRCMGTHATTRYNQLVRRQWLLSWPRFKHHAAMALLQAKKELQACRHLLQLMQASLVRRLTALGM
jgi:hypothetical protein